jgi:hypothetical protein
MEPISAHEGTWRTHCPLVKLGLDSFVKEALFQDQPLNSRGGKTTSTVYGGPDTCLGRNGYQNAILSGFVGGSL